MKLFQGVVFYAADGHEAAASTLRKYGGRQVDDRSAVEDAAATHLVCAKDEYYKYESLEDRLHVVTVRETGSAAIGVGALTCAGAMGQAVCEVSLVVEVKPK